MKFSALIVAVGSLIGSGALAASIATKSDSAADADATCARCHMSFYPGGGGTYGCVRRSDPGNWGAKYCMFTGPTTCSTSGFGSC